MKAQFLQTYGKAPDFLPADIDIPAIKSGHGWCAWQGR